MTRKSSSLLNILGAVVLAVAGAAFLWFLATQLRLHPQLERSAIGFNGLVVLLSEQDRSARVFTGGSQLETDDIGVRIVPLYREVGDIAFPFGEQDEAAYLMPPARSMATRVLESKVGDAPTLIILPKWSDGVRLSGLAHPDFLLANEARITEDAPAEDGLDASSQDEADDASLTGEAEEAGEERWDDEVLNRSEDEVTYRDPLDDEIEFVEPLELPVPVLGSANTQRLETVRSAQLGTLSLMAPQYVEAPENCDALIGDRERALLLECARQNSDMVYWILSDPDVLNNHGLHLGDNARAALNIMDRVSGGGEIVLDYSTQRWSSSDDDRRTIAELMRFFAPPFAWIWLAAGLLFLLAWWRGAVRDRPIFSIFGHGHSGTRYTTVAAQARLMRNTDRDGALLRVLANQRVLSLCDHLLGRDERASDRKARMLAFVERRNPDLAKRLVEVLEEAEAAPERLSPGAAVALLTRIETAYEEARELA